MERVIELEDRGQDFTRLFVDKDNVITGAAPFQGWVWQGCKILNRSIRPGINLRLRRQGERKEMTLKYAVVTVRNLPPRSKQTL